MRLIGIVSEVMREIEIMNVREFKKWLDQFPDDTEVKVFNGTDWDYFEGGDIINECSDQWNFVDYTKNPRITQEIHPHVYGKKILFLGDQ